MMNAGVCGVKLAPGEGESFFKRTMSPCTGNTKIQKNALLKSSFYSDDNPLAPALPPSGAHGTLRCLCITCTGNFSSIANR